MNDYIDIYCERLEPGLWAEPLNAVTNLAFLIAAFLLYRLATLEGKLTKEIGLLIALVAAIGIGSGLFHTFATGWAKLSDVLPILLFQIAFIVIYARIVIGVGSVWIFRLIMGFILLTIGVGYLPYDWFNGSLGYAPAFIYLTGFGIYHWRTEKKERAGLLIAAAVFFVSLTFRSIDMAVCPHITFGVHFLWHCLNAVVLYLCVYVLIRNHAAAKEIPAEANNK